MERSIRVGVLGLWLVSLLLPAALTDQGRVLVGGELLARGLLALVALFPFSVFASPLYLLSVASNALVLREAFFIRESGREFSLRLALALMGAAALNLYVVCQLGASRPSGRSPVPSLLELPAAYLWLGSFWVLAALAAWGHRAFFAGTAWRVALAGAVAFAVVAAGMAALSLTR